MSCGVKKERDEEDKQFILDFIEAYRSLPGLWDLTDPDYSDRCKKAEAYEILLDKFREKYPGADRSQVKRKINTLRTNYRRERRRLDLTNRKESILSERNEPSLWYFDELSFIEKNKTAGPSTLSASESNEETQDIKRPIKKKIKNTSGDPLDELITLASKRLQKEPDNFKKMSDVWASKLREMQPEQQLYAEKFINEILFEGLLGNLHKHSIDVAPTDSETAFPVALKKRNRNMRNK